MARIKIKPAPVAKSGMDFYYPPTVKDDFSKYLNTDIPNATFTFELIKDWYARDSKCYVPTFIRGLMFPINWKSKIGNSDASVNFKTDFTQTVDKGDILLREDGSIFMLNWKVHNNLNNQASQAADFNIMLAVERYIPRTLDNETGMVLEESHIDTVCPDIPAIVSLYAGRPDFAPSYNSPGITADNLLSGQVQANSKTRMMRIDDEFTWYHYRYRIIDVQHTEVDPRTGYGIINFNARRVAGAFTDE